MPTANRLIWLDSLRLIAGVSMVALHATADPQGQPWVGYPETDRVLPIIIRTIVYTARTELFLVISLFLLMMALDRRPRTYAETVQEQARRLLIPFLFWTLVFAGFNFVKGAAFGYTDGLRAEIVQPATWAAWLLLGEVKYHMHFLPTLFALVLAFPLYRLAVRHPATGLLIIVALVAKRELDTTIYAALWDSEALNWVVRGVKVLTYIGYGMVAGAAYGLWTRLERRERAMWWPAILWIGVILMSFKLVGATRTVQSGTWPHDYTPGFWADFLMPVVLFAGAMSLAHRNWPPILSRLAPFSFGIYLSHPIFLDLMEIAMRDQGLSPGTQVALKIAVAIPAASALVWILSRVSPLAWTVGLGPLPRWPGRHALSTPAGRAAPHGPEPGPEQVPAHVSIPQQETSRP